MSNKASEKLAEVLGLPRRSLAIAIEGNKLIAAGKLDADAVEQFVKDKHAEYASVPGSVGSDNDKLEAAQAVVRDYVSDRT